MSKLFNYGTSDGYGGWSDRSKYFDDKEIDTVFSSSVKPRENPRVAVPSPFARFQIIKEAFDNVCGLSVGRDSDDRDIMLVSQVLDLMEFIYEGGIQREGLEIRRISIREVTNILESFGQEDEISGTRLLGSTLRDYADRERYGLRENDVLYSIHRHGEPIAISSPTSVVLPTPNYNEWNDILINGVIPMFSIKRGLLERNEDFILYLYSWFEELVTTNNGLPAPLANFGRYLEIQKENANNELKEKLRKVTSISNGKRYTVTRYQNIIPEIWGTEFYSIGGGTATNMIADQSDLRLKPSVPVKSLPLILTTNCINSNLVYTSGQTFWNSKKAGFSYADPVLKSQSVHERHVLPNGQEYADGWIYEHDLLADTLIQLPYKYNSDIFFDGNIEGLQSAEIDFIPPIKEEYFKYFTAADLYKNLRMVAHAQYDDPNSIEKIEVFLSLPTTHGKVIELKKTYYLVENLENAISNVISSDSEATGCITPRCGVALNALPFNRAHARNYYAFQLLVDDIRLDDYRIWLNACTYKVDSSEGHNVEEGFSRYVRRTSKATDIPIITSYSLDDGNFDYLKLSFGKEFDKTELMALLIPKKDIPTYRPQKDRKLEFCFDFGTSNTFIAVRDEDGKFLDFKLPTDNEWLVSTISPGNCNDDITIESFVEYGRQEFLPIFGKGRLPFPVSTVLSAPKYPDEEPMMEDEAESNPMLTASIPFIYGSEDFGSQFNRIVNNLKWSNNKKASDPDYTAIFINELMFIAQVFAMKENAELSKCTAYWTYPLSMEGKAIKRLQKLWQNSFSKFFKGETDADSDEGTKSNVRSFPESMAPMLYLLNKVKLNGETALSVDIGGGTCDLVIVPDGKISKLKATSIGFGADCIFGIKGKSASEVKMFKLAVKSITQTLNKKANSKDPNAPTFATKAEELKKMMDEGIRPSEMSTYLFNLSNNPHLEKISKEISFNKWIQDHGYHHTVFIYYYAALMYYISDLWKSFGDIEKPGKIFFSGGGSKILDIVCSGDRNRLDEYTDELFNLFASDVLEKDQLEDSISVKREEKEPKQITAKGVLVDISSNATLTGIKDKMLDWEKDSELKVFQSYFKMLDNFKGKTFTYGQLEDDETVDEVMDKVKNFHEKLMKFLSNHEELKDNVLDMEDLFVNKFPTDRKLRKAIRNYLSSILEEKNVDPGSEYPDVPFFEIIRNFIIEGMAPDSDIL